MPKGGIGGLRFRMSLPGQLVSITSHGVERNGVRRPFRHWGQFGRRGRRTDLENESSQRRIMIAVLTTDVVIRKGEPDEEEKRRLGTMAMDRGGA